LKVTFKHFGSKDYVVLIWAHDHESPALSLEAHVELDEGRRARIVRAVDDLVLALGDERE